MADEIIAVTLPAQILVAETVKKLPPARYAEADVGMLLLSIVAVGANVVTFYMARSDIAEVLAPLRAYLTSNPKPRRITIKGTNGELDLRLEPDSQISGELLAELVDCTL